ncbi:MAG: glycine cleavage system protein R [Actinomycetes bacterium]
MSLLAVTVIGHDRPGIIAESTAALARLGGNLEDSTMTILRGHFAMVLLVSTDASRAQVEQERSPMESDGTLLVSVREVPQEYDAAAAGAPYLLSVHGADRPGIVSAVTAEVAAVGGNITDLSTRLTGELYVLLAEVDLPHTADADALGRRLDEVADRLEIEASLRPVDSDLM